MSKQYPLTVFSNSPKEINVGPNMWVDNHGSAHVKLLSAVKRPMVRQVSRKIVKHICLFGLLKREHNMSVEQEDTETQYIINEQTKQQITQQ